ncbi:MAG TPA: hypothetical protein VEU33_12800, partial [Archangium sp.]|nr:hypothetical protein [Archangium sp.]
MRHGCWSGGVLPLLWVVGLVACGGTASDQPEALMPVEQAHERERPTGAIRWARHITGEPVILGEFPAEKSGMAVKDGEAHLLVLYSFTGNIDLGERFVRAPGGPASTALALARYAQKTGRLEWLKVFGPGPGVEGDVFGGHLAVDSQRNIILHAAALGVDFGDGPVWQGEYLLKFDRHGRLLWRRSFEADPGNLSVFDLLTDNHDHIIMAGRLIGAVDFGSGRISSKPDPAEGFFGPSPFVVKFSPEGRSQWAYARSEDFG